MMINPLVIPINVFLGIFSVLPWTIRAFFLFSFAITIAAYLFHRFAH